MANNTFQKQALNLLSPICMDINDSVVRPFDSFNKKNCPYIGDQLSPFYATRDKEARYSYFTRNGDKYSIIDSQLCVNGKPVINSIKLTNDITTIHKHDYLTVWRGTWVDFINTSSTNNWYYRDYLISYKSFEIVNNNSVEKLNYKMYFYDDPSITLTKKYSLNSCANIIVDKRFSSQGDRSDTIWGYLIIADYESGTIDIYKVTKYQEYYGSFNSKATIKLIKSISLPSIDGYFNNPYITYAILPDGTCGVSVIPIRGTHLKNTIDVYNFVITNYDTFEIKTNIKFGSSSKYYTFPFYFDDSATFTPKEEKKSAIYYLGNYNDEKGYEVITSEKGSELKPIENLNVFYFGHNIISSSSINGDTVYIGINWDLYFEDNTIKTKDADIRKKVAVSYTLYPNYYHQIGCIKRKKAENDILIPWNFYKQYSVTSHDDMFNGVNLNTVDINEDTLVYNDLPEVIPYQYNNHNYYVNLNNGYFSGLCNENGVLFTPWYSFNYNVLCVDDDLINLQKDDWTEIEIELNYAYNEHPNLLLIYNDRYVLTDSTLKTNVYDIKTHKWYNWANGYNGNLIILTGFFGYQKRPTQEQMETAGIEANTKLLLLAGACNANYEVTGIPFCSSIFPSTRLLGVVKSPNPLITQVLIYSSMKIEIDIYKSDGSKSLVPIYFATLNFTKTYIKENITDLAYPESTNTVLSLSINTLPYQFIKSYNNHDFINIMGNSYPLIYSNNYPIFAYRSLSFIENISNAFVIQNSNYLIFDNKIMSVIYQGDQIISSTIVTDITGMDFIGNTSRQAFFFSKLAKKIYTFTGDVILTELRGANVINYIRNSWYIPADNSIVISCREYDGKDYVYLFGSDSFLKIEFPGLINVFFGNNQLILLDENGVATKLSYFREEGLTPIPIELQTGFFGLGNEMSAVLDCWYIRVYDETHSQAKVTVQQNVLTNIGTSIDAKTITINPQDWDKLTHSYLIRYQPRYQNGIGFQLSITSDVAIYEILASYRQGETQLTAKKAQI